MATQDWFMNTGYDSLKNEEQRLAALNGPSRFWMKEGTSRQIVFLDDIPAAVYEHNPTLDGDWKNWITCLAGSSDQITCCELLGSVAPKTYVGYYTIVDCTEVQGDGAKYMYEIKLLPAKKATVEKFKQKRDKRGTLVGQLFDVSRTVKKDPAVGSEFEFSKEAKMEELFKLVHYKGKKLSEMYAKAESSPDEMTKLKKLFQLQLDDKGQILRKLVPFNYRELLAPRSPSDLKAFLAGKKVTGFGAAPVVVGAGTASADESVPF